MKTPLLLPRSDRVSSVLFALMLMLAAGQAVLHAEISEPDNIIYGTITNAGRLVTAAATNVVLEARKTSGGAVIASYRLGSEAPLGDFYALRIPLEAFSPITEPSASRIGALVYLSLRDESGLREERTVAIAGRGSFVRLDFADPDTDADGMPDRWELLYFGSGTAGDPSADPDGDGRNNLAESQDRTNPLKIDGRHPADRLPADDRLTLTEVDAYANAWLEGLGWPVGPTNIPINHVTRAARLALGGESYTLTNAPPTHAPMWWVNWPFNPAQGLSGTNRALGRALPTSVSAGQTIWVGITVIPHANVLAQAVEDQPPTGWQVGTISHGGVYDAVNRKVKWGPFLDSGERELGYEATAVSAASGQAVFQGTGSFDGLDVPISGPRGIAVSGGAQPFRWTLASMDLQGPRFQLKGNPAADYWIETSTDLITWQTVSSIRTSADGIYDFRPRSAGSHRYFRARLP